MGESRQVKSRERVAAHGEVFTAEREVKAMCNLVKDECERIESRFLEPACGDGNFLAEILQRKLATVRRKYGGRLKRPDFERWSVAAVMSLYGVELLPDNAEACRQRLFSIWVDAYTANIASGPDEACQKILRFILKRNILCGDALTMKQADGTPIVFAEWSFINASQVKRRDFRFDHLLECNKKPEQSQGQNLLPGLEYDRSTHSYIPKPLKEYPPMDYRRLHEQEQ